MFDDFFATLADTAPRILLALAVLVVGWIVARIVSKAVFVVLARSSLEDWASKKLGVRTGGLYGHRIERLVARTVFYVLLVVIMFLVLAILPFRAVHELVSDLLDEIVLSLPKILLAVIIILMAFVVGKLLGFGLTRLLQTLRFDERMNRIGGLDIKETNLARTVGTMAFWFVLGIGIIQGFDALELESVVEPLQVALEELGAVIPNIVGAILILVIGVLVARFVGKVCANLLHEAGFDRFALKLGLISGRPSWLSDALPAVDGSSETVDAAADTPEEPATVEEKADSEVDEADDAECTETTDDTRTTADSSQISGEEGEDVPTDAVNERGRRTPSELAGLIIAIVITLLVASEALSILHLTKLALLLEQFISYLPNVGIAFVIVVAGMWAGKWVREHIDERYVAREEQLQRFAGLACQIGILIFAAAMALQQLGVASDLILTAFAILFGALCLALALAFGLGGREVAGDVVKSKYTGYLKQEAKRTGTTKTRKKRAPRSKTTKKSE